MNPLKLEVFHAYLQEVVDYWKPRHSLSGYSAIAKKHHVKAITKELFFHYGLDKLDTVTRELSDRIRLHLKQLDDNRRQPNPTPDTGRPAEANEKQLQSPTEEKGAEPPHIDTLFGFIRGIKTYTPEEWQDEYEVRKSIETFFNITSDDIRSASREDVLELKAARNLFGEVEDLSELWPLSSGTVKHAILTMLFADEYGIQRKINMDMRGRRCPQHEAMLRTLSDHGFLDGLLFARIETYKGNVLFIVVYKDAPDILVAFNADYETEYRNIRQFELRPYDDDVIISTEIIGSYGYGTRGNMIRFVDGVAFYKSSAIALQKGLPVELKGKLLYDLRNLDELKGLLKSKEHESKV